MPHILILSASMTSLDRPSRDLKQATSLKKWGWDVTIVSLFEKEQTVHAIRCLQTKPKKSWWHVFKSHPMLSLRERLFETFSGRPTHNYQGLIAAASVGRYDLIIAHDYYTLSAGVYLAQASGCPLFLDAHEYALTEKDHDALSIKKMVWWIQKRYIAFVQQKYMPFVAHVTTVSAGIAGALQKAYPFLKKLTVLRNLPFYKEVPVRTITTPSVRLLYHGFLVPDRGTELCIQTLVHLDARFSLTIRGRGSASYMASLRALAEKEGVTGRVFFEPLAPLETLIDTTSQYDVGLSLTPYTANVQIQHALPNKFFEYIMAGLGVCVTDFPAMAEIVKQYDLGLLIPQPTPEAIAEALSSLSVEDLNRYKKNALHAAKELCWEREEETFKTLVKTHVKGRL